MLPRAQICTPRGAEGSGKRGKHASHAESRLSKGPVLNPALPKSFSSSWASASAGWGGISACPLSITAPSRLTPGLLGKTLQGHCFQTPGQVARNSGEEHCEVLQGLTNPPCCTGLGWQHRAQCARGAPQQLSFSNELPMACEQ